jgi:hypothetical protein
MMRNLRRILGIFVMIAGILGLLLSLGGLVAVWVAKPTLETSLGNTFVLLNENVTNSQNIMQITAEALGATVDSVDALSSMLGATASSVEDTNPLFAQLNTIMGETLPATLQSATESLNTAQQAAVVLDSTIVSLENFRAVISATPLLGALVDQPAQPYNPEKPLADSLGELASNLEGLPDTFVEMAANLDAADSNLGTIQSNLTTMADSVKLISKSLSEYEAMVIQSQASMENLKTTLTGIQGRLNTILNWVAIVFTLFFLWLLAAQVVILSQGWELFQGTAGRMEGGHAVVVEEEMPAVEEPKSRSTEK